MTFGHGAGHRTGLASEDSPMLEVTDEDPCPGDVVAVRAGATPALAQASPSGDAAAPGLLRIDVDARDLARRIFKVTATVPVKPGPVTLLYPQWIPGNHSPTGPIDKLAGLRVTANGKPLAWQRDQYNVYAFKVDVPEGVSEIVAHFDFLSSQGGSQGRVVMTPEMLNLQWNANSLSGRRRCAQPAGAGQ